jgi:cell division protease FtsH
VRRLIEHAHDVAREIIETNRTVLDRLAGELVEHETVDVDRVHDLFQPVEPFVGRGAGRPSAAAAASEPNSPPRRGTR